ncbi:unnamed protein product [Caenorhabditis brenneri]
MDTLFSNLAGMPDVDLHTEKRLTAVESDNVNVIANIKTLRDDFIKDLLVVSQLDLQFSRFKSAVADMPETMKQVSGVLNGGNSTLVETSTEAAGSDWEKSVMIGGGIISGLVFIVVIILCCRDCCGLRTKTIGRMCKKRRSTDGGGGGNDNVDVEKGSGTQVTGSSSTTGTTKTPTATDPGTNKTTAAATGKGTGKPKVPSKAQQKTGAPGTNGGAGGSGGAQQVQQVQQEAAPLQNAVPNGAGNNINAQQSNNQTTGGERGSRKGTSLLDKICCKRNSRARTRSSSRDDSDGGMYNNDANLPPGHMGHLIPTYPVDLGKNDCTKDEGNETLADIRTDFSVKGPINN